MASRSATLSYTKTLETCDLEMSLEKSFQRTTQEQFPPDAVSTQRLLLAFPLAFTAVAKMTSFCVDLLETMAVHILSHRQTTHKTYN